MFLLFAVLLNGFLFFAGTLVFGLFWTLCAYFVYVTVAYFRGSHNSGIDTWDTVRALPVWRGFVETRIVDEGKFNEDGRYIFVVLPNITNNALVWGFGLHGMPTWARLRLCYLMPNIFFYLPVVREFLLLSGAVCADGNGDDRVLEMIRRGRNVVYAPNGMSDALHVHEAAEIRAKKPSMTLYTHAVQRGYEIVPCIVEGENDDVYMFASTEWIRAAQRYFLRVLDYPFPLLYVRRGERLEITVGTPIRSANRQPHDVQEETLRALKALNNSGASTKELSFDNE